ncbi:MAG: ribulokinase [Sphingobacteriales bacterium]|nr:MAG: ribulokinase [Sphingobacteriales bacterium]TAF78680.1 MAG: ribulokinase [Sphingobacteriales bacterium]
MITTNYVIGVDYGSDSVRSIILDASNGQEKASSVFYYPRWRDKLYCDSSLNQFRQHPLDYTEGLIHTIKDCINKSDIVDTTTIKGISIDTTGSTPIAVNNAGIPLALLPQFKDNPNAMFVLWKDHTAIKEAEEINLHATKFDINYLQFVGGTYSSEWYWAKLLHILRSDEAVAKACHSWVEHCDWLPFLLTGGTDTKDIKISRCAAGHKGLWADDFGGFPPDDFFTSLDPLLQGFISKLPTKTYTADIEAGKLSPEWAQKLGLHTNVAIGVGAFDAHVGAVGGQIEPYFLSKVMGTSTCDILVAPVTEIAKKLVNGICGQVNGSVIPGMVGMEAGQSAFGDTYAWFKNLLLWPIENLTQQSNIDNQTIEVLKRLFEDAVIPELSRQAAIIPLSEKNELSVDWLNGRRSPNANQNLKAAITHLSLGTNAPHIFKALVEGTCFGAKKIVDCFTSQGIPIKGIIGIGGVAKKSPYVMQTMADVLGMPIKIHQAEHTCAIGAAMFAAVVAGIYPSINHAMFAMGSGFSEVYTPNIKQQNLYNIRYDKYCKLSSLVEYNL